jgi:hypothetical protein
MATSKFAPDAALDAFLDYIAGSTGMIVCSGASNPANRAAALTAGLTGGSTPAFTTMTGGDFTKADEAGSPYGRSVTVAAKSGIEVATTGDATCVVLADGTNIRYITTCTTQTLTDGNTVNIPAWKVQIGDPT